MFIGNKISITSIELPGACLQVDHALALSVVVPTRNEAGNVRMLLTAIQKAFGGTQIEVIFVDDSDDDTPRVVGAAANHFPGLHVRLIHRPAGQRAGALGGAVTLGLKAARAEYACVMDGDLQHPPEMLPVLLRTAQEKKADLVAASRRSQTSQVKGLNRARDLVSRGLDWIGRLFFPAQLKGVSDPLTGFFLVRVRAIDLDGLRPNGFKILMDMLVRNPQLRKAEVPFTFEKRFSGKSKAGVSEAWKYLCLLLNLRFGEGALRFTGFALVGLSGILVNSLIMFLVTDLIGFHYLYSAVVATVVSTLWNFILIDSFVYRSSGGEKKRIQRLGLFTAMNLLALSMRAPMIYSLTSSLGLHYVLSNLISLLVMTCLRFLLADNIIWRQTVHAASATNTKTIYGD
jgi:putative flippase GtrA